MYKLKTFITSLVLCLSCVMAYGQNKITGNVSDVNKEPIIGASILVKGTTSGTITDFDGNFSLNAAQGATLEVSYLGYIKQEITVKGNSLKVILKEDAQALDEVVVVGFGTQKKVNLTGSVGIATAKDLDSRPVTNTAQALQGLVPGLTISSSSGELDKGMNINIRGTGTIGGSSSGSPLILIDGMEGDMNTVNPQDIENISVLKDAAASSIYGSRAPFGVILITTKKGKSGKTVVNYNNSFRVSSPINMAQPMDSYTFANMYNSAAINGKQGAIFTDKTMQKMLDFQAAGKTTTGGLETDGKLWGKPAGDPFTTGFANTNWYKEIYKDNTFSQEHNLSMSGGTDKLNYYTSFGYLDQNGALRHGSDGLKRYNATAKINAELAPWAHLNYSVRFTRTNNYRPTNFNSTLYDNLVRQGWPNLPVYDENGFYTTSNATTAAMSLELGGKRKVESDNLVQQIAFVFEPIKQWLTHVELNYDTYTSNTKEYQLPYYNHDVAGNQLNGTESSYLYQNNTKNNRFNLNIFSEYTHSFNEVHNVKVMVGFQGDDMKQNYFSGQGFGLLDPSLTVLDLTSGIGGDGKAKNPIVGGATNEWSTAGFFGRLNYDYKGKYLAELNMRYDGTSRFRTDSRWAWYPSFSLGWNIAREDFWEPLLDTVNTLKLRASYGELGNQNTKAWYPTYRTMELGAANGSWIQDGLQPNTAGVGGLVSTVLTWETIRSWNAGLDYGLFNNRLQGSFDIYARYTDGMLGPAPQLPAVLGITPPSTNNSDLKTIGWEWEIGWNDRLSNGLGYGVKFSLSDAVTTVDSYPTNKTRALNSYIKGTKLNEIWGYETVGIAKTQKEMDDHLVSVGGLKKGQPFGTEWGPGDIMYKNIDGKPGITNGASTLDDHGDLKVIGNSTPRYHFALDLSADYKGFDIRAFFQGVMKRDYMFSEDAPMFWGTVSGQWYSNGLREHGDYFRAKPIGLKGHEIAANLNSYYPRPVFGSNKNHKSQTRYLQDASYIRLKNLQLGYTLPTAWIKNIAANKARIFVSAENLWTGTNLSKLFDPETLTSGGPHGGGNAYPLSRTLSFGLNVTF